MAHALVKGGLPASEVTFRTACAAEAIEAMIKAEPDMLVGAGTVLNVEQAEKAVKAGAKFIVSPGYNPDVVDWCIQLCQESQILQKSQLVSTRALHI